jgi:galactosylceramidase
MRFALFGFFLSLEVQSQPTNYATYMLPNASICDNPTYPSTCVPWLGVGGIGGGGSAKLLMDYDATTRDLILDFLFLPNLGASLQILQVEIEGDGNGGWGSSSSYSHSPESGVFLGGASSIWLASEARKRNPKIVLYAVPYSWPQWVNINEGDTSPFGQDGNQAQANECVGYIVLWLQEVLNNYDLSFDYIGIWKINKQFTDITNQQLYIQTLSDTLRSSGLSTKILCGDQDNTWSCATVMKDNEDSLAPMISLIGAPGINPSNDARTEAKTNNSPLLSTDFGDLGISADVQCFGLGSRMVNATLNGISGMITVPIVSGSYYLIPRWNQGLIRADQPWSGSFYVAPTLWTLAHTSRFILPGWLVFTNSGNIDDSTGMLSFGGTYTFAFDPTNFRDFTIVIAKFLSSQGDWTQPENAMFNLPPFLAEQWRGDPLTLVTSTYKFDVGADGGYNNISYFDTSSVQVLSNGSISISLWKHSHYTITSLNKGDAIKGDYQIPPTPYSFPESYTNHFSVDDNECGPLGLGSQGKFFFDVNGAFECALAPVTNEDVLQQKAADAPFSSFADIRPHTIFGDPQWTDMDLTVVFRLLDASDVALIGVRCSTWGSINPETANNLPGVWVQASPVAWGVILGLDTTKYNNPIILQQFPEPIGTDTWNTIRIIARGDSIIIIMNGNLLGRVSVPKSRGAPTSGFAGLGTGDFGQYVQFDSVELKKVDSICSKIAVEGQQAFADQCSSETNGQSFLFETSENNYPAGQFVYAANVSLCLQQNVTEQPGDTKFLILSVCDSTELRQMWRIETTIADGPFQSGPIVNLMDGGVLDLFYSGVDDNTQVDTYEWFEQSNQIAYYDSSGEVIQFLQYGTCLTVCDRLGG